MMKKYTLISFLGALALLGCTSDVGVDPSSKYADRPAQYIIDYDDSYYGYHNTPLPDCTDEFEGVVVYTPNSSKVYACVEGYWVFMRQISPNSDEARNAVPYISVGGKVYEKI